MSSKIKLRDKKGTDFSQKIPQKQWPCSKMKTQPIEGYAAVMAAVILSSLLLAMSLSAAVMAYYRRQDSLSRESLKISSFLAQSCINVAVAYMAKNPDYSPSDVGDCVGVGDKCGQEGAKKICKICQTANGSDGQKLITAGAVYRNSKSVFTAKLTPATGGYLISSVQRLFSYTSLCVLP